MAINLKFIKKMALPLILAIFLVSLDRGLKIYALNYLGSRGISLIGDILRFDLAKNTGIAFSIPVSASILLVLLVVVMLSLLVYLLFLVKKEDFTSAVYLTIILFGAISNMYDRVRYGFVIDYINLKWFTVFNVADSMIVVAIFLLMFFNFRKDAQQ